MTWRRVPGALIRLLLLSIAAAGGAVACGSRAAEPGQASAAAGHTPTFDKDIAPILFEHCATCHRPGQSAPFTLLTYDDVTRKSGRIVKAITTGHMPPWLPQKGYGDFLGERRLQDAEIATIRKWVDGGMPEGNAADLPKKPVWPEGWELGTPDLVITLPHAYTLEPSDKDVFRNFVLPLNLPTGRYVRALEFRPEGAPVHHAVVSIDRTRVSRRRDGADGVPGYDGMITQGAQSPDGHFLGWTPGRGPILSPEGMPWRLDRGSDLIVQLHLLPGKQPITVRPVIGLYFSQAPPRATPLMIKMGSKAIDIPAGERNYVISDSYTLPVDVDLISIYPHAHYLGKHMEARATLPDGSTRWLLRIDDWDFHWQQDYRYVTPVSLPRGTTIAMSFSYDNSAENSHNPSKPPRPVVCGPNSSDEMGDLWLQVLPKSIGDAAVLTREFVQRETRANVAGAELLVRRVPDDARNQAFLGSSYVEAGRPAEALSHLQYALKLDPNSANAENYLAGALLSLGRTSEAIDHFRRAVALDPKDERLPFNLGNALNAAGRPDEAAREFERSLAINPEFGEAHDNMGVYLLSKDRTAEALTHLRRAVELIPNSPDAHNDLGAALGNSGHPAEALQEVQRALEIAPGYPPAQQNLAILQHQTTRGH